jgi:latrophilin 2
MQISCRVVTALLHYLFLSVFCWMLSEGVMLYLMLWVVFSRLSTKWWFFFMLGWCKLQGMHCMVATD